MLPYLLLETSALQSTFGHTSFCTRGEAVVHTICTTNKYCFIGFRSQNF